MQIIGYALIAIGVFWVISRLMNQPILFKSLKEGSVTILGYLKAELILGLGFGVLLIVLGYLLAH